jgi:transcriptional regulator with XRE-family HTH domain
MIDRQAVVREKAVSRAIGEELRRTREANGWSRAHLTARLPSGIGDRTLLSYEHGARHLTLLRFLELCQALDVSGPSLLNQALQRARLYLQNLALQIDLRHLIDDDNDRFRPVIQWARNKLAENPGGVVELPPASIRDMAAFLGWPHQDLTNYLAQFIPDEPIDS